MAASVDNHNTLDLIRQAMKCEAAAIEYSMQHLGDECVASVDLIRQCSGKLVVVGVGKSGCVARKAAATFSSTGVPATFLHAAEAAHGDLGMVSAGDVVLALSQSGQTAEILNLIPYMQRFKIPMICITGNPNSELARRSQHMIHIDFGTEAGHNGLAPTSSSTVAMAVCDAIAITIAQQRGFTADQFAMYHPGGMLGRKLLLKTSSIMHRGEDIPSANQDMQLREAIGVISRKGLGSLLVVENDQLTGIVTDGDIRRVLESSDNPLSLPLGKFMISKPVVLQQNTLAIEALRLMQHHSITVLPIVDEQQKLVGILHLHDLMKAGLA